MNFLLTIKHILSNERGQTPATSTATSQVDPRILDYFLGVSKPSTGLLGEGAFSALGANPQQFSQMSGLPAMAGAQDLFRVNPAEAEQMSLAESKARQNILNNTPMRGGELNQGLAQNTMHFGGLRQKLVEDRRNEALAALQGLSGFKIPSAQTIQQQERGATGASQGSQFLAGAGNLLGQAVLPSLTSGISGLFGLGTPPEPNFVPLGTFSPFGDVGTVSPWDSFTGFLSGLFK